MAQDIGLQPPVDGSVWNGTLGLRIGGYLQGLTNAFLMCIQAIAPASNATAAYEKCGLIIESILEDPSDYVAGITKDLVSAAFSTDIASSNKLGRAWGIYAQAGIQPGGDGLVQGAEIGVSNFGSDQPELDTPTTKVALSLVAGEAGGNNPITAVCYPSGGQSKFHYGFVMRQNDLVGDKPFLSLLKKDTNSPVFAVLPTGELIVTASGVTSKVTTTQIKGIDGRVHNVLAF